MAKELQQIEQAKEQLREAEEMNGFEAIVEAGSQGEAANIDVSLILGRIQMSQTFAKFASAVSLSVMKQVKESKSYRELKGKTITVLGSAGEKQVVLDGTWEGFCRLCHTSKSNVDDQLRNLDTFGESALKSMQMLGMTTRDLKKLRNLPEEELKAIVDGDEVKVSDREEALELIEEMAVKHRKETRSLQNKLNQSEQTNKANSTLLAEKNKKIDELSLKLDKPLTKVQQRQQEQERNGKLLQDLSMAEHQIDVGLAQFFDTVATIQNGSRPVDVDEAYQDALGRVVNRLLSHAMDAGQPHSILATLKEFEEEVSLYQFNEE